MNPGEVATVIMQFNLPTLPASMGNPLSSRTGGHEYVWHCHILEHEEHDMPLVLLYNDPVAVVGDDEPMQVKLETVLKCGAVDLRYQAAG